jgi:hypothetical protein
MADDGGAGSKDDGGEALETLVGLGAELPLIEWSELARHSTKEDMWVCIDHIVYNMTNFIAIVAGEVDADTGMAVARHPGGMDLPMQFAGNSSAVPVAFPAEFIHRQCCWLLLSVPWRLA